MEQQTQWQWQEEGSSWKGIGIYHLTLTIPSREPLLGALVIPDNDPTQARVERTELGSALLDCQRSVSVFHPEIQILQYCLMPDHLHTVWYVRQPMEHSIRYVAQGFWRAAKKAGRAFSYLNAQPRLTGGATDERAVLPLSSLSPADSRETPLRTLLGADAYYRLEPLFTEVPFIRPMSRRGQLQAEHYATVHVRHDLVDEAVQGKPQRLRNYMNGCVLAARHGVVMVSPFISPHEKAVMAVLLNEQHSFILLADNGFRDYYKPSDNIFDAVAAGRALVLSPWAYDAGKRHITRADCVALNGMAEEIASM